MLALSGTLSKLWIADMRALYSLRVLALSLPFISVCNVLSSYFIASKNVIYGCTAQILEQLTRMGIVVLAAAYFSKYSLPVMLAAVFAANTLSEAVSCMYLGLRDVYKRQASPCRFIICDKSFVAPSISGSIKITTLPRRCV